MKIGISSIIMVLFALLSHAQTRTVTSATCGSCKKAVSASSKVGDRCPHCGVRWGYENSTTTSVPNSQLYFNYNQKSTESKSYNQSKSSYTTKTKSSPFASYSKQEMENWLEEKLNKYQKERISCFQNFKCRTDSEYEFKLDGTFLIIKYNHDNIVDKVEYLPLYDFSYVSSKYNEISISNSKTIAGSSNGSNKSLTSFITIGFDTESENNIIENIESAFLRLKNLYKRPISEELPNISFKSDINKPTVSETQDWILSKLNTYTSKKFGCSSNEYSISNPYFSFSGFNLLLKYNNDFNEVFTITIPVCECENGHISIFYPNKFTSCNYSFSSPKENIIKTFNGKSISLESINLEINLKKEDDLFKRLQKAFKNLKSYCPTITKRNEKF